VPRSNRTRLAATFALLALTLAVYLPALGLDYIWDDGEYVIHSPTLRSLEGLGQAWFDIGATQQYYPMVHTSLWIEYRLWELNPTGYHFVNILLHAFSAVLLWRILSFLRLPGAWIAAAIFAVHPVQVETVAWITERKNVLSGLFYLAAAWNYLPFALPGSTEPTSRRRGRYLLALLLFALAMLSKTVVASLPAALLLVIWWKKGRLAAKDVVPLLPFFAVGIALASVTLWIETTQLGATGATWELSIAERCLIAGRALWFYAGKLIWPAELIFIYPRWALDAASAAQYVAPAAALSLLGLFWGMRNRWGRGPLTAALFFGGTLVPAIGFFDVYFMRYSFVQDHFQYLACIGAISLAVGAAGRLFLRRGLWGLRAGIGVAAGILAILSLLTLRQLPIYMNEESLWRDTLRKNPAASIAHNNLGNILLDSGRDEEGTSHLQEAVRLEPDHVEALYSLGTALLAQGRPEAAVAPLARVVDLTPTDAEARDHLGLALTQAGRLDEAAAEFETQLATRPEEPLILHRLSRVRLRQQRLDEAAELLLRALSATPDSAELLADLGMVEFMRGRLDDSVVRFESALGLRPDYFLARHRLGMVMLSLQRPEEAALQFRAAIETEPAFAEAYRGLAQALQQLNDAAASRRAQERYQDLISR